MAYECRVTEHGISHLFAPMHVGAVCACGRKAVMLTERGIVMGDIETPRAPASFGALDRLAPRLALRRRLRSRRGSAVAGPDANDRDLFVIPALARQRLADPLPSRMC